MPQVEALAEIRGDQVLAEWGQQIRSYVLAPYKMATSNPGPNPNPSHL